MPRVIMEDPGYSLGLVVIAITDKMFWCNKRDWLVVTGVDVTAVFVILRLTGTGHPLLVRSQLR